VFAPRACKLLDAPGNALSLVILIGVSGDNHGGAIGLGRAQRFLKAWYDTVMRD
jgi:hypothetical protein